VSLQYGELRPTSGSDRFVSLGRPIKFQRVSRLGSVTARHSSIGLQPNFAALNRGRHLYSARRPSRWALAHISSCWINQSKPISTGNWARIPVREDSSVHRPKRVCLHVVFTIHFTINSRSFSVAVRTLDLPRQSNQHYLRLYCN